MMIEEIYTYKGKTCTIFQDKLKRWMHSLAQENFWPVEIFFGIDECKMYQILNFSHNSCKFEQLTVFHLKAVIPISVAGTTGGL